jgi:diguanylate cyclase (GGDEF)-like protein
MNPEPSPPPRPRQERKAPNFSMTQRVLQSIRFRLSILFVAAFVGISALSTWQLQSRMAPAFLQMEHDSALQSAQRVISLMDAQLSVLNTLNRDWAAWDDMYEFVLRPTPVFIASNLSDDALKNTGLHGVAVLSTSGSLVAFQTRPLSNGQTLQPQALDSIREVLISLLDVANQGGRCGYVVPPSADAATPSTLLLLCANPISRTNGTDGHAGIVVTARELSASLIHDIETQSQERLAFFPPGQALPERWPLPAFTHLPASSAGVAYGDDILTLEFDLPGLTRHPLQTVRLQLDRKLIRQGQTATHQITVQLAVTVLVTCLLLLIVVHFGFVMPLRRLRQDVRTIHENKQWQSTVAVRRSDEIGVLAHEVNGLLGVIRGQVEALTSLSMTDALTGLPNRRRFDQRLEEEINRVLRKAQPLCLLMVDIDYFKQYNDHYGHPAGDVALKQVAQVLRDMSRKSDLPARMGGEEFAVMLIDTPAADALLFADKLVQGLRNAQIPHAKSKVCPVLTISIGVAVFDPAHDTPAQFVTHADMALYAAKAAGRNRALAYTSESSE